MTAHDITRIAADSGIDPVTVRRFLKDPAKARRSTCRLIVSSAEKLGVVGQIPMPPTGSVGATDVVSAWREYLGGIL